MPQTSDDSETIRSSVSVPPPTNSDDPVVAVMNSVNAVVGSDAEKPNLVPPFTPGGSTSREKLSQFSSNFAPFREADLQYLGPGQCNHDQVAAVIAFKVIR